jgi:hypothetical protein
MLPAASPFPCHWWGIGLTQAGLASVRPDVGTYGRYSFEQLPPIPFALNGDLAWLAEAAPVKDSVIADECAARSCAAWPALQASALERGLRLPAVFVRFLDSPLLQERIRSCTACYLDLCPQLLPSPLGGGHLLRFLADQQGCLFWYLYLAEDASDHAVLCSPCFHGLPEEQWQQEPPEPGALAFCAESFELFLARFWLENEIWFAAYEGTALPPGGREYLDSYLPAGRH